MRRDKYRRGAKGRWVVAWVPCEWVRLRVRLEGGESAQSITLAKKAGKPLSLDQCILAKSIPPPRPRLRRRLRLGRGSGWISSSGHARLSK